MGEPERAAAVLDDGTGVYFWDGVDTARFGTEWAFMGVYRCDGCGRSVTIVRFARAEDSERMFRRQQSSKQCPGGCETAHAWLAPAAI